MIEDVNLLAQIDSFALGVKRSRKEIIELILNDYFNCTSKARLLHDVLILEELEK